MNRIEIAATGAAAETVGATAVGVMGAARTRKGTPSTASEKEKAASPVGGAIPTGIRNRGGTSVKERHAGPEDEDRESADTAEAAPDEDAAAGASIRVRAFRGES